MRKLLAIFLGLTAALLFAGCSTFTTPKEPSTPQSQRYFLDPSIEFSNYHTYGFLQVTAVRYQDPISVDKKPKNTLWGKKKENRAEIHHTDELIWRVLSDEMANKGYAQVAPSDANCDLWVIYYGGPRPISSAADLPVRGSTFDEYFWRNEFRPNTFFVDIIDVKRHKLIYRGWDNLLFVSPAPQPDDVVSSAQNCSSFFPSRR